MAIVNLLPTATGAYSAWTIGAGSRPTLAQTNDGLTSYCLNRFLVHDSYAVDNMPADAASITTVQCQAYMNQDQSGDAGTCTLFVRYSATNTFGSAFGLTTSWVLKTYTFPNVPGGSGWTVAEVDGTEAGVRHDATSSVWAQYTMLFLRVTYVQSGETFIPFYYSVLAPLLAPLIGAGLTLDQFTAAVRLVSRVRYDDAELEKMWRISNALTHPHSVDLAVAA